MATKPFIPNSSIVLLVVIVLLAACTKPAINREGAENAPDMLQSKISKATDRPSQVIDQQNTDLLSPFSYNIVLAPMGQEFTPALHALDAVELQFGDASCSLVGSAGGNLSVLIRKEGVNGPVLGTSEPVHFPNCFIGAMRFNFPDFIPLTPGQRYFIQPEFLSGHTVTLFLDNNNSSYAGGRFMLQGIIQPEKDLWFREGLYNFIALTKEQAKDGGWRRLVRHDGTPFKNQGDCIQYINNGH